jgi:hypothetical protein
MKAPLIIFVFFVFVNATAQNVGIGVPVPAEKLDVNGNINVSGTIKANGTTGQNGQVLMTSSSGNLVWADLSDYKNFITFSNFGPGTWTVPAGVTKIYAEVWGGGGGGTGTGGGGGGGYIAGIIIVTPGGSVSYSIGAGGAAGSPTASDGGSSYVLYSTSTLQANGGAGNTYTTYGSAALGGGYNLPNGTSFMGQNGEAGGSNSFGYHQSNATTFLESQTGGKGGDGGSSPNSGGKGTYQLRNASTFANIYALYGSPGRIPGGGGGGNITWGGIIWAGAQGLVIIHY